jgi:hypothetical protein
MSFKVESPQHFSGRVINLKNSENSRVGLSIAAQAAE